MKNPFKRHKIQQFMGRTWRGRWRQIVEWTMNRRLPYISWTLDPACPGGCKCCLSKEFAAANLRRGIKRMTLTQFKLYLSNVPKKVLIDFSGYGEALTNPQMPDMALWAHEQGYLVQVFSTLMGLTREGAEKLSRIKLEKFVIHVPDKTNFQHDTIKWLGLLWNLVQLPFPTKQYAALGEVNHRIKNVIGAKNIQYPRITDKAPLAEAGYNRRYQRGRLTCNFAGDRLDQWAINCNGDVSPCAFDYQGKYVIGNLGTQTYDAIMYGKPMMEFRAAMMSDNSEVLCRHCNESVEV